MTQGRFYSSTAVAATLTSGVSATATLLPVSSVTGFPTSYPYTLIISRDQGGEEVVSVTGASGLTLTVARAQDGTSGATHSAGATVEHGVSARDFTEPQQHIGGTTGVHGLTGAPVGTTDTQTLSNKTLAAPTIADFTNATHAHDTAAHGGDLGLGAWTSYTPVVNGSSSDPTFSAGAVRGRYKASGKTLQFAIAISGAATGAGSGFYKFNLPPGYVAYSGTGTVVQACNGAAATSTITARAGECKISGGTSFLTLTIDGTDIGSTSGTITFVYLSGVIEID